ncbi:hypothetical protein SPRG_01251 [Saprolegnia parasitica CBS 223.65]|uniref:RZZ complex subunit KNTC1/ROD C-terminal domain-containing protein n=1 Tax=Saprolegnia parasitica (strain CBS 223.65) TaxID=695850 RepID=A0A067CXH4_SAPPC|nr:hypothetical protein SPRG_01251 [Saprolegnia parasitica CBS 223.65]KDO33975.1 hypothetical protein SPRG_01251 [Saprolegnia parasitica CBS 223.65]|eukprot:XP_012194865.1 hypothetical protein SPRG_01251 [Saprolegnia parasitica CBS 223.65]
MEATYGHERMEAFREEGDDPMHMNHCFLLDAGRRPRMLLAMSGADGGSSRCVEMGLDASRWERCAAVTCISTIVHGSMELELRGLLDGSVQLARVGDGDECTVLLTYPIAKDDPITQAQMAVRDGTLLDIFVLLRSGKLIAVEDVDLNDLAVDPPPALPTLFQKVRLRMAAVGAQTHAERSSMMQLARNPNGSTTVFVANHGQAVVSRWTSGLVPAPGDPNKVSHSFIRDSSVTIASTTGPVLHLHLSDDAQFLVVVSSSCITWWDAATLTFLHELPVENIAAACALSPWSLAVACKTNTTTVTVQVVSLQYRGPWRSTSDVTSCTSIACPGRRKSVLVPCGPDLLLIGMTSENVIETYRVFQQQAPLAPLGVSPLQQLCDAMQDPNHAVSTESFQLAIWTHVQASPDAIAAILELTFPRSEDMDTLFDALESWAYDEQDGLADAALLARIASVQYKWTTFQLLCAPDVAPIALDAWLSFRSAPLDDVLRLLLTQGALSRLQVLWRRHVSTELVRAFSLELLPSDVSAKTVRSWILDDVLPAFEEYRVSLHDLTTAIVQRATALADDGDVDEARAWTELLRPQRIPKDRLWRYPPRHGDGHQSPHDDLRALDVQLQQLAYLDEVHGFHLSLRAFQMASMAGIAMSMLDRVLVPDLMASELACHVQPLLALCDTVSLDDVLTEYIAEKATSSQLLQTTEAHRCRVLIPRIESVEKRAAAALAFLQAVRAPYDAEIVALAHDAGTWPSLCRVELQAQLRVMELQDMCVAYGLRPFLATDALFASRFCRFICGQIDRPSALDDALQLARAFRHLHEHRIVVQFSQNVLASTWSDERQGRLLAALKALATPTRWSVAVEVVQFGLLRLETYERNGEKDALGHALSYVLGFVSAVLTQYDAAKDGPHALLERTITLPLRRDLIKMAALFKEFGIALSLRTYQRDGSHTELLESQLQPWVKSLTPPAPSLKRKRVTQVVTVAKPPAASAEALAAVNTTQRLSSLLGQTPDQFRSFLALLAAKAGNTDQALRFARRSHPVQLKDVAVALLRHLVAANRTVQHAPNINLAVEILTLAVLQNPRVITAWPLLKLASLLQHIYSFTDDQTRQRDAIYEALQSWRVYDEWYRGSSVVLAPSVVPLAVQYVMALWTHDSDEDRLVMAATPLLSHLVDAQAHPLAIKALLHMPTVPQDARPVLGRQLDHMLSVIMHAPRIDRDLALG